MTLEMHLSDGLPKTLKKPPLKRGWYYCPKCHTKLAIFDNTARVEGLYIKCRTCKMEVPVKI